MKRYFLTAFCAFFAIASPGFSQDVVPDSRFIVSRGVDFYGGDLAPVFDTDLDSCIRACTINDDCAALTFNQSSNACFPKKGIEREEKFNGAISARRVLTPQQIRTRAEGLRADLDFVQDATIDRAVAQARDIGFRHPAGSASSANLIAAGQKASSEGRTRSALGWFGAAISVNDDAVLWSEYARLRLDLADQDKRARRKHFQEASYAALNAFLRGSTRPVRAEALRLFAMAVEKQGNGRMMIDALRLATDQHPRQDLNEMLDDAIGKYGFRVTATRVESDSAAPRICSEFSEPLVKAGVDYSVFTRLPDPTLAVSVNDRELCIEGVVHGERYRITFRSGLPAASGEEMVRDVVINQYVRDRTPAVRFSGRAHVLPKGGPAAIPVETVNTDAVSLELFHVSDRNLLGALRAGYVGRPLWGYEQEHLSEEIATRVWQGTLELQSVLNRDVTTRIPLAEALRDAPTGIYALKAVLPEADPFDDPASVQWFVLSDIGLAVLDGTDGVSVQAASLSSAQPLPGVRLTLVSHANAILGEVTTDAQGFGAFPAGLSRGVGASGPALILAERGEHDIGFLSLTGPAFDLSDRGVSGRPASGAIDVFATLDRGAYRVGETVHAVALMRDALTRAVDGVPLTAVVLRPDGVEAARLVSAVGTDGGHLFSVPVPETAQRGTWRIEFKVDPKGETLTTQTFLVEDFLPERIDFALSVPSEPVHPGAGTVLPVSVQYLFGAPGAGLEVSGEVRRRPVRSLEARPGYLFGRHDVPLHPRATVLPAGLTDATGAADLLLDLPEMPDVFMPSEAVATVRVREGSGRPVERQARMAVRPGSDLIGIRPLFDGALPEGGEAEFDILGLNPDLDPVGMDVTWSLNRLHTRYQWYEVYGDWKWEPVTRRERIATGELTTAGTPVRIATPVEWGEYELVAERTDGRYTEASVLFSAGWYAPAGSDTPDTLEVALDKPRYAPGDTASLRIVAQQAGTAFVSVLSDRVISRKTVELPRGESVVPIDVTTDWGTGAYVSVSLLHPVTDAKARGSVRQLGLAHAAVDPGDRALSVTINAPDQIRPRGTLTADLSVDGLAEGQTAHVTLAAVDVGILNLTGFTPPDPQGHYFGQRRLGVELRDLYDRLIDAKAGNMGRVRSGGDANAGSAFDAPPPTEDLMAVFRGPVAVGPDGKVQLEIPVGAFNGTVRLMAVVWSDTGVGQASRDVIARDPVVMTSSLPRFLAPGDRSRLLLELTHADGPAGAVSLAFASDGIALGRDTLEVVLRENGRAALAVDIEALSLGDHMVTVYATLPDQSVIRNDLRIGVRSNDAEVSITRRFRLGAGETLRLGDAIFDGFRKDSGHALVSAGPLARLDTPGLLSQLDRYPYGCTEQVTSVAMPLLYLSRIAESAGLGARAETDQRIATAITQVLSRQAANGSFGLWRPQSGDFWLDAYVTDFLSRARAEGHHVPDRAFDMAIDNLSNRVNYASDFDRGGEALAYALYVLAREGAASMSDLRYYGDEKADAFATPLAKAQIGAALASYGDQLRADRLFGHAAESLGATTERRGWRSDYGTMMRDRAGVLTLVAEANSTAVDTDILVRDLVAVGRTRRSTQEAVWTLLASHALMKSPQTQLEVDGALQAGPFVRVLSGNDDPLAIRAVSENGTDVTLTTFGVPEVAQDAGGTAYAIDRAYFDMDGAPVEIDQVRQGARMVVVLEVRAVRDNGARLMIDDPLPAGFEIDNPNILRSGDLSGLNWLELSYVENAEFRADRFLAAVNLRGDRVARVAYQVRAISPGTFHHPAAVVEDMYRPEDRGWTGTGQVRIVAE